MMERKGKKTCVSLTLRNYASQFHVCKSIAPHRYVQSLEQFDNTVVKIKYNNTDTS